MDDDKFWLVMAIERVKKNDSENEKDAWKGTLAFFAVALLIASTWSMALAYATGTIHHQS